MTLARARGTRTGRWLASATLGLPAILFGLGCGGPTRIDEAFDAANANLETPQGKAYDDKIGGLLGRPEFRQLVRSCVDQVRGQAPTFSVLLQLDASGKPIESEIWPILPVSQCARDSMLSIGFPAPPKPAFWIQIEVLNQARPAR